MNRRYFTSALLASAAGIAMARPRAAGAAAPAHADSSVTLSVMLWTILPAQPLERRIEVVATAGYRSIELVDEFAHWTSADFTTFNGRCRALGLGVDAICVKGFGVANPTTAGDFLAALEQRIAVAETLNCRDIIVLSGPRVAGLAEAEQRDAAISVLKRGGELAGQRGRRLILESLDPEEAPRCFLNSVTQGFYIVQAVSHPAVRMLYDFYHEQISGGNLLKKLNDHIDLVGLVHVADVPGRHEFGTGEINYTTLLGRLATLGYSGAIAMEFLPTGEPVASLSAAREFAEQALRLPAPGRGPV